MIAETEETEIMTAVADQIAVIPDWIPDLLFLLRDREHAVVKDHRKMTDVIWRNVRGDISRTFSLIFTEKALILRFVKVIREYTNKIMEYDAQLTK